MVEEPKQPARPESQEQLEVQQAPVPVQDKPDASASSKAQSGEPEALRNIEAKLRAMPLWLVLVGALALGLAVGGIGYLLRGLMELLFGGTP